MYLKKLFSLLLSSLMLSPSLPAQDSDEEDVFELSPFQVDASSSGGYRASSMLSGSRVNSGPSSKPQPSVLILDNGATINGVSGPFDPQLNTAIGVSIEFAVGFYNDYEKTRRDTLNRYLDEVEANIGADPALHFEPGAMLIPQGDRKKNKDKRRSSYTSHAYFTVSFDFSDGGSPFKRVKAIRRMIGEMELGGDDEYTKMFFGGATLIQETPEFGSISGNPARSIGLRYSRTANLGVGRTQVVDALGRPIHSAVPTVPVSLVKRIDQVSIPFGLDCFSGKGTERKEILEERVDRIREAVSKDPSLDFQLGAFTFNRGNQAERDSKVRSAYRGSVQFRISYQPEDSEATLDRVGEIRNMIDELDLESDSVALGFYQAALVVENPEAYRAEIIQAIFRDLSALDETMGDSFVIEPTIAPSRVQVAQRSPTKIEVWIPYSYEIASIRERELELKKLEMRHEEAMVPECSGKGCCNGIVLKASSE